ncbi:MAG: ATP-binding protein [Pirellula sp.]
MPSLPRTLQPVVERVANSFPVLLLTGPRQVGKTTLLEACAGSKRRYVTLDDLEERALARHDPELFLSRHPAPVIIDEVQYAPELFSRIKMIADREKRDGLFWLTGSQKFHLMREVTESLAGRVAILDLLGLSQRELTGHAHTVQPFLPTKDWLNTVPAAVKKPQTVAAVYENIWQGSLPRLRTRADVDRDIFFRGYIETYIQRDVRDLARVGDETRFLRFVKAVAARTAQLLNYADMARDTDIDQKTAKAWLSILEASGLVYLLPPWHSNVTKRIVKTPKMYFFDTGLCAYLTGWSSAESLEAGAMSGAILETFMVTEILKSYWHTGKQPRFYFYRDRDGAVVDLLIEQYNRLYPVEFKKTASPGLNAAKYFKALETLQPDVGEGAVVCLKETEVAISTTVTAIPVWYL